MWKYTSISRIFDVAPDIRHPYSHKDFAVFGGNAGTIIRVTEGNEVDIHLFLSSFPPA